MVTYQIKNMLFLSFFVLLSFSTSIYCADHNTFKNCSRVTFCKNLRARPTSVTYDGDSSTLAVHGNRMTVTLHGRNSGLPNLTLSVYLLAERSFRVQIDDGSKRYDISHIVLEKEPSPPSQRMKPIILNSDVNQTEFALGESLVKVEFIPFKLIFSYKDTQQVVFEGDRLTMAAISNGIAPYSFGVTFTQASQLYGLHEHADSLALQTTSPGGIDPYRLKNSDVSGYELNSPMALYGAIPVLYGHGANGTSGIFLLNAAEQWIEITNSPNNSQAYFMVETGALDLFVFLGPKPSEVVQQYVTLTGKADLPPLWSLGYHQSRWSYNTQAEVTEVLDNFNRNNFPLDAIWLDIDYTDAYQYFTWNPQNYSDPIALQKVFDQQKRKLVTIIDPHIKVKTGYSVYDGALSKRFFVQNPNGTDFQGDCWPGRSSYIDFLNPAAREFYGDYYSYGKFNKTTSAIGGIWNDMNEPSVFDDSLEKTLPVDAVHIGGVKHREIHNLYGLLHTMATHSGLLKRDNGTVRPFILTRSHFAGTQRFSAIWTGDNTADWGYLAVSISQCLNSNLLGIVFCGADVGGFAGNPTEELFQRWYQAGAWLPFYRAHSALGTNRREPYLFSLAIQSIVRTALQIRYMHIPVWYTLFFEHYKFGAPILRPLFYQYPQDLNVLRIDDQFFVGNDILVRPVSKAEVSSVPVYFPGGENELWVSARGSDVRRGRGYVNIDVTIYDIPVYYRVGSVIVVKEGVRTSTADLANVLYVLYVIPDLNSYAARGTVYLDDNTSLNYKNTLDYNYLTIDILGKEVTISNTDGLGKHQFGISKIVYRNITRPPTHADSGMYEDVVFHTDKFGNSLKDAFTLDKEISQKTFSLF